MIIKKTEYCNYFTSSLIDKVFKHLPAKDILTPEERNKHYTLTLRIKKIANQFFIWIKRWQTKIFNDGVWYDEARALRLVIDYSKAKSYVSPDHKKIVEIYHRLSHLSKDDGSWADGINEDLFIDKDDPSKEVFSDELDEVSLEDPFMYEEVKNDHDDNSSAPSDNLSPIFNHVKNLGEITAGQLFHIHADEFGRGSELEGGKSETAVDYLLNYLQKTSQTNGTPPPYLSALIEELKHPLNINFVPTSSDRTKDKKKALQKISDAFQQKKTLLIVGGWTAKPAGHAIYYELIPESKESATIRLYNAGSGADEHYNVTSGNKVKHQTYCEWKGIDRKKLESLSFLEALYELKHCATYYPNHNTEYDQDDIYKGLKDYLNPIEEIPSNVKIDQMEMMSRQRAGVCSWKSLMALVRTKMGKSDYKLFKSNIKLQSLVDYVNGCDKKINIRDWRLVHKSHQKLCRALIKLHKSGIVGNKYLKTAQQALVPISTWIQDNAYLRYKRKIEPFPSHYSKLEGKGVISNPSHLKISLDKSSKSVHPLKSNLQPSLQMIEAFKQLNTKTLTPIGDNLKEVNLLAEQAWKNHNDLTLYHGIVNFVVHLDLNKDFWNKAIGGDQKNGEALIEELGKLAQIFTKSCFTVPDAHINFPEKVYVIQKLLHIQEFLCRSSHPNSLCEKIKIKLKDEITCKIKDDLFFNYTHDQMHHEMSELFPETKAPPFHPVRIAKYYISEPTEQGINLRFNFANLDGEHSDYIKKYNKNLCDLIRKEYPQIVNEISKKDNLFASLPTYSQDARLYVSPLLPNWIKSMRDTELASLYLTQMPIGPLTKLDRINDLKLTFEVKDETSSSKVLISLKGVDESLLNIPEVKKFKENPKLRHAGQYPEITTKPLQQVFSFVSGLIETKEKILLNTHAKWEKIDMADEEFKEIARLSFKPALQHIEAIEYFTLHPGKLKETDYQTLLHILLFKNSWLEKILKKEGFADILAEFLQKNYEQFKEQNELQTSVFILKIAHQLKRYYPEKEFFNTTASKLEAMLKSKELDSDVKASIYCEMLAQFNQKEKLNENEITLLLVGSIYIEENQSNSKYKEDPFARKEARHALLKHAHLVKSHLTIGNPNQKILNQILRTLRPDSKENRTWILNDKQNDFPSFSTSDGKHLYYPLLNLLVSPTIPTLLPWTIRQNPLFKELFPSIEKGSFNSGNIYSFYDLKGRYNLVYMKGDCIIIEQKRSTKEWVRYIPRNILTDQTNKKELKSHMGSRYLIDHYNHWQSLENGEPSHKIYVTHPKTGNDEYLLTTTLPQTKNEAAQFTCKEVKRLSDGLKLGNSSKLLSSFEDSTYIHEWYDDENLLQEIELPRFNLSFKKSPQESEKLLCQQFPNYWLNTKTNVKELGIHHHYILLENSKGEKKVLLPWQEIMPPDKTEVLLPRYEMNRELEYENKNRQHYFTFDLQKNGRFYSQSREANLYLAQVLSTAQEYKKAGFYLKKFAEKLSAYTVQEKEILKAISDIGHITGDQSGNGIALQLFAQYLIIKNSISNQQEESVDEIETLKKLYDLYINEYSNVTVFKFKPFEEIFILKTLLKENFDVILFIRLKELDPEAANQINITPPKVIEKHNASSALVFKIPSLKPSKDSEKVSYLLTRPFDAMENKFLDFYTAAKSGDSDQKKWD